jgi:hypothetical protein
MSTSTLDAPLAPPLENNSSMERQLRWVRRVALLLIAIAALHVRAQTLDFSTGYMDETIYVLYGRMFLSGNFEAPLDTPLRWSFGWYLWPAMAAAAEKLGGIPAVRALGALLGALSVFAVYGFARRMFTPVVGLASAAMFALLAPSVYVFRIATRDAGAVFFFAIGLWMFARAWQQRERVSWLAAAAAFFAAFLCKYVVAVFFPFLALLTLRQGRAACLYFGAMLTAFCGLYGLLYFEDLQHLLSYASGYTGLRAAPEELWRIYGCERVDFWILLLLSLAARRRGDPQRTRSALVLWLGAFLVLLFQWSTAADHDYWKHVNYALLFVIPLAATGLLRIIRRWSEQQFFVLATLGVLVLSVGLGWWGGTWRPERWFFWPNVEPALAFFDGRLHPQSRVLTDDSALRYYLQPPLDQQARIVDPFQPEYPYARKVSDGDFDFIVLNGGIGREAEALNRAIRPLLRERFALRLAQPQVSRRARLEIYERISPPPLVPAARGPQVEIIWPVSGSIVATRNTATTLEGRVKGAPAGARVRIDVFTNRWYPQSGGVPLAADGRFWQTIYLGGLGEFQCAHLIRARVYDSSGKLLNSAIAYSVASAEPDGSPPPCAIRGDNRAARR